MQGPTHTRPRPASAREADIAAPSFRSRPIPGPTADTGGPSSARDRADLQGRLEHARRFGHSLDHLIESAAELAPPEDLPAGTDPIQRLPTAGQFGRGIIDADGNDDNLFIKQMRNALTRYHRQKQPGWFSFKSTHQKFADDRSKALDDMEHAAYRWMDVNKRSPSTQKQHGVLMDMLDQIQKAHAEHIEYIHTNNLELHTPDRDAMAPEEKTQLQSAWNKLRNGSGLIKMPGKDVTPQGARELRAMHARLLSRPAGRSLLYQILDEKDGPDKEVSIRSTDPVTSTPEQRKGWRDQKQRADAEIEPRIKQLEEELESLVKKGDVPKLALRKLLDEKSELEAEAATIRHQAAYPGAAEADATDKEKATETEARQGSGSGSRINVRTGLRDSELMNEDAKGNYIPAPAFVIYGHELIHALHNRRGSSRTALDSDSYRVAPMTKWDDQEEHHTIHSDDDHAITENALRAEHGLTKRKWHTGRTREEVEEDEAAA